MHNINVRFDSTGCAGVSPEDAAAESAHVGRHRQVPDGGRLASRGQSDGANLHKDRHHEPRRVRNQQLQQIERNARQSAQGRRWNPPRRHHPYVIQILNIYDQTQALK